MLLDVDELTERADNAIKFLSDMFSARLYKVAASKIGVTDYKDLVNQKVHTAEELYRFMIDQFHQSRAFVLELMVVIILIIELLYFFQGKMSKILCNFFRPDRSEAPAESGEGPSGFEDSKERAPWKPDAGARSHFVMPTEGDGWKRMDSYNVNCPDN